VSPQPLPPSLVYLLGSPGVGKRTVADALHDLTGAVVVDNSRISLPIASLFDWDGSTRLPDTYWAYVDRVRDATLDALAEIAPREASFVLTNALETTHLAWLERIEGIAEIRGARFVPVLLECELEEQLGRVGTDDRKARLKLSDPAVAREFIAGSEFYRPTGPTSLAIDTTSRSPEESARLVADHVRRLAAG
jgi:predicted kinase